MVRLAGKRTIERSDVFCPVAFAGIGHLPPTLEDRSVVVKMTKANGRPLDRFIPAVHEPLGQLLGQELEVWCQLHAGELADAWAEVAGVHDRRLEIWQPLLAIADAAGGRWSEAARKACRMLEGDEASSADDAVARLTERADQLAQGWD